MMGKGKREQHLVCTTLEAGPWSLPAVPCGCLCQTLRDSVLTHKAWGHMQGQTP